MWKVRTYGRINLDYENFFLKILKSYKRFISPFLSVGNFIFPIACKFYPTCSEYSHEVFQKYGTQKGFLLSFKRICHCHPFSKGGVDLS